MTKCAIYARFSSDLQDARSITDQIAACRTKATALGYSIAAEYSDAAISGATMHRPGLNDLLRAASAGAFDLILTEALDRLSRDLADISAIWRDLSFLGVRVVTLSEGEINFMHVGIKGIVGQMFLTDLAMKTRRGHVGRLHAGRIPGGKCYGYDCVLGEDKGLRTINDGEAAVIRRIFQNYDTGMSSIEIASALNRDRVPSPRGGQWNASTIHGSAARASGILQNRLYVGEIVYGRQKFDKNPKTGKRIAKVLAEAEWLVEPAPHLAIVDRALFDRAQAQRHARGGGTGKKVRAQRRPKHLFSGLVSCGCCGAAMIVTETGRVGCSARKNKGTCSHRTSIKISEIEARILAALRTHLLAPEIVATAVEAYREERGRLQAERQRLARDAARDLAQIDGKIARIIAAIEDGTGSAALSARLTALESQRNELTKAAPEPLTDNVLALHPTAANRYRGKVEEIAQALAKGDAAARDVMMLVRELIQRITITPATGGGHELEIDGNLSVILERTGTRHADSQFRPPLPMLAGPRQIPFKLTG